MGQKANQGICVKIWEIWFYLCMLLRAYPTVPGMHVFFELVIMRLVLTSEKVCYPN